MSEENDKKVINDMFAGLVGIILFILISITMVAWQENSANYYLEHPEVVPGTVLFIGVIIGFPLLAYATLLTTRGIGLIFNYAIAQGASKEEELTI